MERLAGRIMLLWGWPRILLAVAAGAIGVLAQAPFGFFAAFFVSFTLLTWLIDGATGRPGSGWLSSLGAAFRLGWLFGFGYFTAGLWWLGHAFLLEAEEFAWALPLAVLGLPAYLALFYGLAVTIARLLWSDGFGRLCALGLGFGLAEWLRGFVATGFPWNAVGYGIMPMPLMMQSAGFFGIFGVSALAVVVFAAPALIGTGKGMRAGLGVAALLFAAHLGYGAYRLYLQPEPATDQARATMVRIVQPAIDQSRKFDNAERAAIFAEHLALSDLPPQDGGKRPDIIVWPETSVPFILTENPDALARIGDVLTEGQILVAGVVRAEDAGIGFAPRFYNSVYVIDSDGQILAAADKVHLVPFGEYVPYQAILEKLGVSDAIAMPGGFSAAPARAMLPLPDGRQLYPLICYEAIFPDEIGAEVERAAALLNLTNDAWFGATPGPYQHFHQARLRAVETGLPMIRAANNGISAVIDPLGRVLSGLSHDSKGITDARLPDASPGHWQASDRSRHFWLLLAGLLVAAVAARVAFDRRVD